MVGRGRCRGGKLERGSDGVGVVLGCVGGC